MKKLFFVILALGLFYEGAAQITPCNCTASVSGNQNFSTLSWTPNTPGTCPTAGSTSYTGNLCLNLAAGANLTMDKDFTVNGGLGVSNNGSSTFTLPVNMQLTVTGSMGDDANNNVSFIIDGDLAVGGTFYGKNNNGFTGSGSITAGGLDFGNKTVCTSPADCSGIDWNVKDCQLPTSDFCKIVRALPVTLLFFQSEVNGDAVKLTWATATESNAAYFAVERSGDAKDFYEIGRLDAAGNSLSRKDYALLDKHPLVGRAYYRLKQVDIDGTTEYFNVKFVDFKGKKGVLVYPNPLNTADEITLSLNFAAEENSHVRVTDLSGHEIFTGIFAGAKTSLPSNLAKGSYIVTVANSGETYVTRFIVR